VSERTDRKLVTSYRDLVVRAMALVREHGDYIGMARYPMKSDFCPINDEGVSLSFDGDVATLHFTMDGHESEWASSFDFEAAALWSRKAVADAIKRRRRERAERAAAEALRKAEYERAEYERLRRRFQSTDLRNDIRRAIEIEARIAVEDEALK
jgi:hypothetical protein